MPPQAEQLGHTRVVHLPHLRPPARKPLQYPNRPNLDYDALVRPWLCEQTLTCETYTNSEQTGWFSALTGLALLTWMCCSHSRRRTQGGGPRRLCFRLSRLLHALLLIC